MNTGQTVLTIAAMFLLSVLILRFNTTLLSTSSVMLDTKFGVLGVSLATSIIEEASEKAFDSATDTTAISDINDLTYPAFLGPAPGETYELFNDIDDFNRFTKIDSTMPSAVFTISCRVTYVDPDNLEVPSYHKTWCKKITVTVTSPSMPDTIRMSSVYSYWYFR